MTVGWFLLSGSSSTINIGNNLIMKYLFISIFLFIYCQCSILTWSHFQFYFTPLLLHVSSILSNHNSFPFYISVLLNIDLCKTAIMFLKMFIDDTTSVLTAFICDITDLLQPKTLTLSTRALIWMHKKLCINVLNQFSVYFHMKIVHDKI